MIAHWSSDLKCGFANASYMEWFGRTPADMLGISKDVLSRLENGRSVSLDKLFKVLNGLGLNMLVFTNQETSAVLDSVGTLNTQASGSPSEPS